MSFKAMLLLAEGFEELEAVTVIDVLRRAEIDLTLAGVAGETVTSVRKVKITADAVLSKINPDDYQLVILPGGQPGTNNLMKSEPVKKIITDFSSKQKWIAAICAAPMVLANAGILEGRNATCFPGCEGGLYGATMLKDNVVLDKQVLTSRGPGTALAFALKIVEQIKGKDKAKQVAEAMLVPF